MPNNSHLDSPASKSFKENYYDWEKGVTKFVRDNQLVLEVDTDKAEFHGKAWKTLGDFGKRKWENMLFLHNQHGALRTVFCYKP